MGLNFSGSAASWGFRDLSSLSAFYIGSSIVLDCITPLETQFKSKIEDEWKQ